jgi:hypothetical protein
MFISLINPSAIRIIKHRRQYEHGNKGHAEVRSVPAEDAHAVVLTY